METRKIQPEEELITIPDGADIFLLDEMGSPGNPKALSIKVGRGCRLRYLLFFNPDISSPYEGRRELTVGDGSEVDTWQAYFGAGDCSLNIDSRLGEKVIFRQQAFFFQNRNQSLRITDNNIFERPGSTGRFRTDGLIDNQARAEYFSELAIAAGAQETDSRIDLKLYLLSPEARGTMQSGLKIKANRVKAGHGASTFHLAEEDLFYLRSRGLSPSQAKALAVRSVAERFAASVGEPEYREMIMAAVKLRL